MFIKIRPRGDLSNSRKKKSRWESIYGLIIEIPNVGTFAPYL